MHANNYDDYVEPNHQFQLKLAVSKWNRINFCIYCFVSFLSDSMKEFYDHHYYKHKIIHFISIYFSFGVHKTKKSTKKNKKQWSTDILIPALFQKNSEKESEATENYETEKKETKKYSLFFFCCYMHSIKGYFAPFFEIFSSVCSFMCAFNVSSDLVIAFNFHLYYVFATIFSFFSFCYCFLLFSVFRFLFYFLQMTIRALII